MKMLKHFLFLRQDSKVLFGAGCWVPALAPNKKKRNYWM